jgi:hypothetical protein
MHRRSLPYFKISARYSTRLTSRLQCPGSQVATLVELGANATIVGRRKETTEGKAAELQAVRPGSKVIGISADVRDFGALEAAVERAVKELGRLDYVMFVSHPPSHFSSYGLELMWGVGLCGAAGNFPSRHMHLLRRRPSTPYPTFYVWNWVLMVSPAT